MNLSDYEPFPKKKDGIPKYPLYGYDNTEAINRDINYMKANYPLAVREILKEIETECDKLEYEGSFMFDTHPDPLEWHPLVDKIYENYTQKEALSTANCRGSSCGPNRPPQGPGFPPPPPGPPHGPGFPPPPGPPHRPCGPGRNCRPPRPDYRPDGQPDWMRNLISVLLTNEIMNRRRRYRSRKQWI